jgi:hypothetical protein
MKSINIINKKVKKICVPGTIGNEANFTGTNKQSIGKNMTVA